MAGRVYKDRTGEVFGTFEITGEGFCPEGSRRLFYPCTCEKCHVTVDVPYANLKDGTAVCDTCEENKRKMKALSSKKRSRSKKAAMTPATVEKDTAAEAAVPEKAAVVKESAPMKDETTVEEVSLATIGLGDLQEDVIMDQYENKDTDLVTALMGTPERPEGEDDHIYALRRIYRCIISRCYNPLDSKYDQYGAKGIKIDKIWYDENKSNIVIDEDKFMNFARWAMVKGWAEGKTLVRKDTNENYSPKNCKLVWISDLVKK